MQIQPGDLLQTTDTEARLYMALTAPDAMGACRCVPVTADPAPWRADHATVPLAAGDMESGSLPETLYAVPGCAQRLEAQRVQAVPGRVSRPVLERLMRLAVTEPARDYSRAFHTPAPFEPGVSRINYAGRVFDEAEVVNMVESSLDCWLTAGRYASEMEGRLKDFFGARKALLVNSGSSANLVMLAALCSPLVERPLVPGDEVVTPAVTFPTTLAPILQHGLTPVFVDCEPDTLNIDASKIEAALSPRTRAVVVPHTLGNPCELDTLTALCREHGLVLLEDVCDALGSRWDGQPCGTFGPMASLSFYPAHHITMGEGGAVIVNDPDCLRAALSVRDWGRDCWCGGGENNRCGRRYSQQHGDLPYGYDHKYVYSSIGYNLKVSDMQAAVGCAQLDKLDAFMAARKANFGLYMELFSELEDHFILPRAEAKADPCWFGFPLTCRPGLDRTALLVHLEEAGVESRLIFGGNILKQPAFLDIPHRVAGSLEHTDGVMVNAFFLGVYPGMTRDKIEYTFERVREHLKRA